MAAVPAAWNIKLGDLVSESQERAWLDDYIVELIGYPGEDDDQVDATTRRRTIAASPRSSKPLSKLSRDRRSAGFSAAGSLAWLGQTDKNGGIDPLLSFPISSSTGGEHRKATVGATGGMRQGTKPLAR